MTDREEKSKTRRSLSALLLAALDDNTEALDEARFKIEKKLFGENPVYFAEVQNVSSEDPRLVELLDVTIALSFLDLDDPAYYWNRAPILFAVGRYYDAAKDYVEAAVRFQRLADTSTGFTGDEDDWAKTAFYHACKSFMIAGFYVSAARLLQQLTPEDREELEELMEKRLAEGTKTDSSEDLGS